MSIATVASPVDQDALYIPVGPEPFTPQVRRVHYDLDHVGLRSLMREEEELAFRALTSSLPERAQHRLEAIERELDQRWSQFG